MVVIFFGYQKRRKFIRCGVVKIFAKDDDSKPDLLNSRFPRISIHNAPVD